MGVYTTVSTQHAQRLWQKRQICWCRMPHWATWGPEMLTQQHFVFALCTMYYMQQWGKNVSLRNLNDSLQLNLEDTNFADSEGPDAPRRQTEIIWNLWLFYLSLFEEVQRYLDILKSMKSHSSFFSGLQCKEKRTRTLSKAKLMNKSVKHHKCKMQQRVDYSRHFHNAVEKNVWGTSRGRWLWNKPLKTCLWQTMLIISKYFSLDFPDLLLVMTIIQF